MKTWLLVLVVALLPAQILGQCSYGCSCYTDSQCYYYCGGGICQNSIPYGGRCSGHGIHPNECGSLSYCDSGMGYTCQFQKSDGSRCYYDYYCMSGYCESRSSTCQQRPFFYAYWMVPMIVGSVAFSIIVIVIVTIIRLRRRRLMMGGFYTPPYAVVPPPPPPRGTYSYQNSNYVGEAPPPPYPGPILTKAPESYQS